MLIRWHFRLDTTWWSHMLCSRLKLDGWMSPFSGATPGQDSTQFLGVSHLDKTVLRPTGTTPGQDPTQFSGVQVRHTWRRLNDFTVVVCTIRRLSIALTAITAIVLSTTRWQTYPPPRHRFLTTPQLFVLVSLTGLWDLSPGPTWRQQLSLDNCAHRSISLNVLVSRTAMNWHQCLGVYFTRCARLSLMSISRSTSLDAKCARFFDSDREFLEEHLERRVGRKVESVETRVRPAM